MAKFAYLVYDIETGYVEVLKYKPVEEEYAVLRKINVTGIDLDDANNRLGVVRFRDVRPEELDPRTISALEALVHGEDD